MEDMKEIKELLLLMNRKMDEGFQSINSRLDSVESDVKGISSRLNSVEVDVKAINYRLDSAEAEMRTTNNRIASLEVGQKMQLGEVRGLRNELHDKLDDIKKELSGFKIQVGEHETHIRTLQRHDKWMDFELSKVLERVDMMEQKV